MSISRLSFSSSTGAVKPTRRPKISLVAPADKVQFGMAVAHDSEAVKKAHKEAAALEVKLLNLITSMREMLKEANAELTAATNLEKQARETLDKAKKSRADVEKWWKNLKDDQKADAGNRRDYRDQCDSWDTAIKKGQEFYDSLKKRLEKAKAARNKLNGIDGRISSLRESAQLVHALRDGVDASQIRAFLSRIKSKHSIS